MNEESVWYDTVDRLRTLDEIYSVATEAKQARSKCDWVLGELAIRVTLSEDGDRTSRSLKHFAGCVNESYGKIKDAARVVKKVSRELRMEFMSLEYGHWREIVNRMDDEDDIRAWAERAEDGGLTVGKLRALLSGGSADVTYEQIIKRVVRDLGTINANFSTAAYEDKDGIDEIGRAIRVFENVREAGRGVDSGERSSGQPEGDEGQAREGGGGADGGYSSDH